MKSLPIGITDFKEIVQGDYLYTDKTMLIHDLLKDAAKVTLFTRPRRFGKTINMSMIQHFFDIREAEENREFFTGLNIGKTEYMREQGKYPVIFVSFKDVQENSMEDCLNSVKLLVSKLFVDYKFLLNELDEFESLAFKNYLLEDVNLSKLKDSLKFLAGILYRKYGEKVIILIDEYDTPLVTAYMNGYYKEAVGFFKNLYMSAMKDNEYLQFGVMTGILRIAKEGIFSGLNNLKVNTIMDRSYSQYFGFTEDETAAAVEAYGLNEMMPEVKRWYNGYTFGNIRLYNPWSIINFLAEKQLKAFWVNTSSNGLINDILEKSGEEIFSDLQKLFNMEYVDKYIDIAANFDNLKNPQEIWQLMLFSGYLTTTGISNDEIYQLRIPNNEVHTFFKKSFIDKFLAGYGSFIEMVYFLKQGKLKEFEQRMQKIFMYSVSSFDTAKDEKYYHMFILGLVLSLMNDYEIKSNDENGYGRSDLTITPKDKSKTGFIFEFKVADSEETLEKKAEEALSQIEEKRYDTSMIEEGVKNITKIGMAFYKKKICMLTN